MDWLQDLLSDTARCRATRLLRREMPELDDIAMSRLLDDIGADPAAPLWNSQAWVRQARDRMTPRWWGPRR